MQATLLTLAIAAILAMLAALVGPHFIDWNAHRATFEQQASQAIGLPVRVTGPMDVRLLPSPTLVLSGVEIGEAHLWTASAAALVAAAKFDRVLGSLHAVPLGGRLTASDDLFRQMPADEVMRRYFGEVLALIGAGMSNGEIADQLVLGEGTVKTHVGHVFAKLGLRDRAAAVVFAFDNGLVVPRSR